MELCSRIASQAPQGYGAASENEMPNRFFSRDRNGSTILLGYIVAALVEVVLTAVLVILKPYYPLHLFPTLQILTIIIIAYYYGTGPAFFAFSIGLMGFAYFFTFPSVVSRPESIAAENWAGLISFFLGSLIGGLTAFFFRRSQLRIRHLAEELDRQKTLLDTLMKNVPVGLAFVDRNLRYIVANRALDEMNQTPFGETVGKTIHEVLSPALASEVEPVIRHVIETGESAFWSEVPSSRWNVQHYIDASFLPVITSDGMVIGVGAVLVDTTEKVTTRQSLERSYNREHHIAETLQTALLGDVPEILGNLRLETVYRAAMEESRVGGDFYDAFQIPCGKTVIAIGDVSGKGLAAAVQVALAKYSLRGRAHECDDPGKLMEQVNSAMVAGTDPEDFVTIFVGIWDHERHRLTYASGGHAPVLLWRSTEHQAEIIYPTGPLVGIIDQAAFSEETIELQPGDELLLGTDGLFEIRCNGRMMELDDLLAIYNETKHSGALTVGPFIDRISEVCDGQFRDDIAVLRVSIAE